MLPSILATQIRQGIKDYLKTGFPVSTPFFHGMLERFLTEEDTLFKGPYLSIKLPFRKGTAGEDYFSGFTMTHPPYLHQQQAFQRLCGKAASSTIIATGTGSGKTECFLYPILDYCYQHRGEPGIKAILIYPMNALANDQAKRLARLIEENANLKGNITAGLFIGQQEEHPASGMLPDKLITDKDTLRLKPPDILLTNYKMLDYLLIRPLDYPIWKENIPESLKYLVVDELHTFDGAQGADLGCLIRRLKKRLKTPKNYLCCVGTSATLGDPPVAGDPNQEFLELLKYAETIFGESFERTAIIRESVLSTNEFFHDSHEIKYSTIVPPEQLEGLKALRYKDIDSYLRAQYQLWFQERLAPETPKQQWCVTLAEKLKQHQFFRILIREMNHQSVSLKQLMENLQQLVPGLANRTLEYQEALFNSFFALISTARVGEKGVLRPFLNVRIQLWVRELARMVSDINDPPVIRFSDDLSIAQRMPHLPLVYCRDCGSTGWGATKRTQDHFLNPDLTKFYRAFFERNPTLVFVFPEDNDPSESSANNNQAQIYQQYLCGSCLQLSAGQQLRECQNCGKNTHLLSVRIEVTQKRGRNTRKSSRNCPICHTSDSLTILGFRAAGLISVAINQLFSSRYNDDKKLITFSDSVQDASHRAGFFGARTFRFGFRSALQQFIEQQEQEIPLDQLSQQLIAHWSGKWSQEKFVATFLPPDLHWLEDYENFRRQGKLSPDSSLLDHLYKRIDWEVYAEYGFNARVGRTLEKSGSSIATPAAALLEEALQQILPGLQNEVGGLRLLDISTLRQFVLGVLTQLKIRGGIFHPALSAYINEKGNSYHFNRILYMPPLTPMARMPAFLTDKSAVQRFDLLLSQHSGNKTWYEEWAIKNLAPLDPFIGKDLDRVYRIILNRLTSRQLVREEGKGTFRVWGLIAAALKVSKAVEQYRCDTCKNSLFTAALEAVWQDAPCLKFNCRGHYTEKIGFGDDYYQRLYATGDIERIFAEEHTALLERQVREQRESCFEKRHFPWDPNVLSCTPTLEMGVDIGNLSSVILCSVPPNQANYTQRIGRSGRKDGNAFNLVLAIARNHDLYFYEDPLEMIAGRVELPGCFLNAPAVLERQFLAFCFDRWLESDEGIVKLPNKLGKILDHCDKKEKQTLFPYNLLAFIGRQGKQLFEQFVALFQKPPLDADAINYLQTFVSEDLACKLVNALKDMAQERKHLRDKVRQLSQRIRKLQNSPAKDQNYEQDLDNLQREKSALNDIIKKITAKDTYNFFTDEGLLPNYSFPEAGVLLRSIIYRKKKKASSTSKYHTTIYEYERPALSAIYEFAPENHFYAEGRKVIINQVDLGLSTVEEWRFCNNCSYMTREATNEHKASCPKCGSSLWADEGQKRSMIRLRQVISSTSDRESRSRDESENRELQFYNRQTLVAVEEHHIEQAFQIDDETLPFGFEFLSKVTLREINFGKKDAGGETIDIAGQKISRNGFEICEKCGMVQSHNSEALHAISCPDYQKKNSPQPIKKRRCLFLYREFSSEAFRILIPVLCQSTTDTAIHTDTTGALNSFIAAIFLGLKKYFGGNIDHLQHTIQQESLEGGAYHRKQYLVLYDRVPGGTGYLKELLRSKQQLLNVFEQALLVLKGCSCELSDNEQDGCYRCLYAYRFSRDIIHISRRTAIDFLSKIIRHKDQLQSIPSINKISVNSLLESELERKFIETLAQFKSSEIPLTLQKDIVNGKPGWYLEVNKQQYFIEPQVNLSTDNDISLSSRADFLIYPERPQLCRPIAVFTDGFAYHVDRNHNTSRVGKDMAQRMAIVHSRKYHTWSLTWADINRQAQTSADYFDNYLINDQSRRNQFLEKYDQEFQIKKLKSIHNIDSFQLLLQYLALPESRMWGAYAFIQWLILLGSDIKKLSSSNVQSIHERLKTEASAQKTLQDKLLSNIQSSTEENYYGGLYHNKAINLFACAPEQVIQKSEWKKVDITARLFDEPERLGDKKVFKAAWNGFLRLYNLYQFLPNSVFVTSQGISDGEYLPLNLEDSNISVSPFPMTDDTLKKLREISDPLIHPLLDLLISEKLPLPEIGYEHCDDTGKIIATAELSWPNQKLVLLREDEMLYQDIFHSQHWQSISLNDFIQYPDNIKEALKSQLQ